MKILYGAMRDEELITQKDLDRITDKNAKNISNAEKRLNKSTSSVFSGNPSLYLKDGSML